MKPEEILGREVSVVIDRPLGSFHPRTRTIRYSVNYGYVPGVMAGDGAAQDVYLLGVPVPVGVYTGVVVGVVHRRDDTEDKWIAAPKGMHFSRREMEEAVAFVEQFFDTELVCREETPERRPVLGVSLSPGVVLGRPGSPAGEALLAEAGGSRKLLAALREAGVGSIELRNVMPGDSPFEAAEAAYRVWEQGLLLTVHTGLRPGNQGRAETFLALHRLLETMPQPELMLMVHALKDQDGETAKRETALALRHLAGALPEATRLALELNRAKGDGDPGHTPGALLEMLEWAELPGLGICWDFGHYYYNVTHGEGREEMVPSETFLQKTVHTHIHAVQDGTTHFPLGRGRLPLGDYAAALRQAGYGGVWNLELEPERFYRGESLWEAYRESIVIMRETVW